LDADSQPSLRPLLGAIAVAAALAFGLGGCEVAKAQLEKWCQVMQKRDEK